MKLWLAVGCAAFALVACGGPPAAEVGAQNFKSTEVSTSPFNLFSCATCHEVVAPGEPTSSRILPGYNLYDTVRREAWWGGFEHRLLDAINVCVEDFMGGAKLKPEQESARTLFEYLAANSGDDPLPPLPFTVVLDATALPQLQGDAQRGEDVYRRACAYCHGQPHTGEGQISARASIVPESTVSRFPDQPRAAVVEKVRHGRYFNIGGVMPLYSLEVLSDQELADILVYVGL